VSIPLDTTPGPTRLPGDFQRHPSTGAPYVSHPTDVTKQGKPKRVMYGRPSSLGKQIENTTNLQKWSERAVALGLFLNLTDLGDRGVAFIDDLEDFDSSQWNLDDPDVRPILDAIAVKAKGIAQAGIAAERGTHTHALTEDADSERDWIERARSGEALGIPVEAQQALVAAWEAMLAAEGMEILAVETAVVDDLWRQAGTLDRIARLTRDRSFTLPGGEIVTLPAGWVGVLDVKTGKLRNGNDGHPDYWHGYAVQIASYAQAVPYDTDADTRGEWAWPIDQRYGIIAHLDVAAAIEGTARCRLVLVDLERGRAAGTLCVAARDWERSRDVFSLVADDAYEVPVTPAVHSPEPAAVEPEGNAATPPAPAATRAELLERYTRMRANANDTGWLARFDAEWAAHGIDKGSTEAQIAAALDAIEAPFDPDPAPPRGIERPEELIVERIDDGDELAQFDIDAAIEAVRKSDARAVVNGWLRQANDAGESWDPRQRRRVRQFEIVRAALALGEATDGDDAVAQVLLALVVGDEAHQLPVGRTLGALTIDEARRVALLSEAFVHDERISLTFTDSGQPVIGGDVAAVLAAA